LIIGLEKEKANLGICLKRLAENTFDVRLSPWTAGVGENGFGWSMFDKLAQVEKNHVVGESSRLSQNVSDEHYRIVFLECDELFLNVKILRKSYGSPV
jgi:hypothetical protein